MDMEMSAAGEALRVAIIADASCTLDQMQMLMDLGMNLSTYVTQGNGVYTMYSGVDVGDGAICWSSSCS